MVDGYARMCVDGSAWPLPYGEGDLKGNAKLGEYRRCFSAKFAERAMGALAELQRPQESQAPAARQAALKESSKQEAAMRDDCRQELGLPLRH